MKRGFAIGVPLLLLAGCGNPEDRLSDDEASVQQGADDFTPERNAEEAGPSPSEELPEPTDAGPVLYKAVGNEPGWSLAVRAARMDYLGDYGEVKIAEPTPPDFRPVNGIYRSGRLRITISPGPCSDGMSDLIYRQTVRVTADSKTVDGCGGGTVAPSTLANTSWTVVSVNGRATPGGGDYFLTFADDRLSAKLGCNSMGGRFRQNGDHVTVASLEQTLMGCPEPAETFEREGSAILRSNMRLERISGERARLVSEAGTLELKRAI